MNEYLIIYGAFSSVVVFLSLSIATLLFIDNKKTHRKLNKFMELLLRVFILSTSIWIVLVLFDVFRSQS